MADLSYLFEVLFIVFVGLLHGDSNIIDLLLTVLNGLLIPQQPLFVLVDDVLGIAFQQAYFCFMDDLLF